MFLNITLPDLSEISDKQNIEKIRGYLATLNDQLRYMMLNIDEDNLSENLSSTINTTAKQALETKDSVIRIDENLSKVSQTADKINWLISDGNSSSDFSLTSGAISLISNSINMGGYVKFSDLSNNGTTVINGSNIISGTISADKLSVSSLESISASIGGWYISGSSISSSAYGKGSFSINSAASSDSCWIRAKNSSGNTTFYISKDGSCYIEGSAILGGSITADKISTDVNKRLNLINNYYGTNIGKELYLNTSNQTCRIFINPSGIMTFDTGTGNTAFSFALTRTNSTYTLSLLNGSGIVLGTIPIN